MNHFNSGERKPSELIKPNHSIHYSWVVLCTTFLALIIAAGVRSTPGVLIVPFEHYFGWNRAVISLALAINLLFYGLCGPFAAALMDLYGPRRIMVFSLLLIAIGTSLSTWILGLAYQPG